MKFIENSWHFIGVVVMDACNLLTLVAMVSWPIEWLDHGIKWSVSLSALIYTCLKINKEFIKRNKDESAKDKS